MANVTRWNPFEEIAGIFPRGLFDRDWLARLRPEGGLAVEWSPRCDMTESDGQTVLHVELPGVDQKDMEVEVREGVLTVRGEKRSEKKEEEKGRVYSERFFGSFERSVTLPPDVDESKISAQLRNGVLEVRFPKAAAASKPEAKKITISG